MPPADPHRRDSAVRRDRLSRLSQASLRIKASLLPELLHGQSPFAVNRRPLLLRLFWGKCIVNFLGQPEPNNNPSWPISQACLVSKRR